MNSRVNWMKVCLILFGIVCAANWVKGDQGVKEDPETVALLTEDLGFKIMKTTGRLSSGGGIYVFDGADKKDIALDRVSRVEVADGALKIAWDTPEDAPAIECEAKPRERHISFAVKFSNKTKKEKWIEARMRFFVKMSKSCRFWDGFELHEGLAQQTVRNTLRGTFPMCCAFEGRTAVAIGIEPSQYFSYLETAFVPGDDKSEIRFSTRIVLDPEKEQTVTFIVYGFDGEYGFEAALAKYYDIFPEVFRALPDVDPRVADNGATYNAWTGKPRPEICRRFYAGWEWCYAPFKRTGDWLGKKEFWDYEPVRELGGARKYGLEKYHEWRRDQLLNGRLCNVGMMFYVPSCVWCEERLAREVYADALTADPNVKTYFDTPWVTGHDNELRVYPWGNKFGDACLEDMKKIAETLDIAGFAFDTAQGGAKYRGPGVKNSPGRAWDEEGVYCDEAVAIGKLMDFVHSQQKNGRRLAVVSNPTGTPAYMCAFKSDSAMFEGTPWGSHGGAGPEHLRRFLGRKTMVWWEDFLLEKVTKWEDLTPEQIRDAYLGLADHVILKSAQVGSLPTPRLSLGVPKIVDRIPALVALVRAGWEPVTGVESSEKFWVARFGRSADTLISVGNPTLGSETYRIAIENSCLGKCSYVFTTYDGGPLRCIAEEGKTKIDLPLKPRGSVILRAQMGIYPPTPLIAAVSEGIAAESRVLSAEIETSRTGKVRFICRIPEGFLPQSVSVNGKNAPHETLNEKLNFDVPLGGQSVISVVFKSETFDSPETQIWDYPFVMDGKPNCEIVVNDNAGEEENYAAQRIQRYFKVYYEEAADPKASIEIPIRKASELKGDEKNLIVLDGTAGEDLIQKVAGGPIRGDGRQKCVKLAKEGAVLCISSSTPAGVRDAAFDLLRVLDIKYPYYGGFPKSDAAMKAGLTGKLLE